MLASTLLRDAKAAVIERGWCQEFAQTVEGHLCMAGALFYAATGQSRCPIFTDLNTEDEWAVRAAERHLVEAVDRQSYIRWNDEPGRSIHEVVEAFEKAEKLALIAEEPKA